MLQELEFPTEPFQGYTEFDELGNYEMELPGTSATPATVPGVPAVKLRPFIETLAEGPAWRAKVDEAIRRHFKLSGFTLAGRVRLLDETAFPKQIPSSMLEEILLTFFLDAPTRWPIADILRHTHMQDPIEVRGVAGHDDKYWKRRIDVLRKFIAERTKIGFFEYSLALPTVPSQQTVTPQILGFSPAELVGEVLGGLTILKPSRADSRVLLQLPADIETFVHEGCHFYAHNNFTGEAKKHETEFFEGMRVSQLLKEGFCEYFSRQVMKANETTLGESDLLSYPPYVAATERIVTTARQSVARDAYFNGNAAAIKRVMASLIANKDAYPLIVPDFVVP
jgi:hypothetical protein